MWHGTLVAHAARLVPLEQRWAGHCSPPAPAIGPWSGGPGAARIGCCHLTRARARRRKIRLTNAATKNTTTGITPSASGRKISDNGQGARTSATRPTAKTIATTRRVSDAQAIPIIHELMPYLAISAALA